VHSVTIDGDETARSSIAALTLKPRLVRHAELPDITRFARRATRYGRARAFFLDADAFVEPSGFWTRARTTADVLIDAGAPDRPPPTLLFRAGPVATAAIVRSGGWSDTISLGPGETQTVTLPALEAGADAWVVQVETTTGFRPADYLAGNEDVRYLGVWVEVQP
jgi:hypothetical protein